MRVIIDASDVRDVAEALSRPFFMGKKVYKDEYDYLGTVVCEPALTVEKIAERARDPRFCVFCFHLVEHDGHDLECRKSAWREFSKLNHTV
jgi:hypothetical protein